MFSKVGKIHNIAIIRPGTDKIEGGCPAQVPKALARNQPNYHKIVLVSQVISETEQ